MAPIKDGRNALNGGDGGGGSKHNQPGEVVYTGQFTELCKDTTTDNACFAEVKTAAADREANGLATHARRLKELDVRVIYISMVSFQSMRAVLFAFAAAGLNSTGYAIVSSGGGIYNVKGAGTGGSLSLPTEAEGMIALKMEHTPCLGDRCKLSAKAAEKEVKEDTNSTVQVALTETDCNAAARRQGLSIGGAGLAFSGDFATKGCYTYSAGEFAGHAFYGTGGTEDQLSEKPSCALLDDGIIRTNQLCLKVRVGFTVGTGVSNNTGTSLVVETVGVVYTDKADLRMCKNGDPPAIGPACEGGAAPVVNLQAFGKSNTTMEVRWVAASVSTSDTLKSGVRVSLFSNDPDEIDIVDTVPSGRTSMIFGLDKLKANVPYSVRVTALYDGGQVEALPTDCRDPGSCGGSLACIPDNAATRTCGCEDKQLHTMGLVGVLPEAWGCHTCLPGLDCRGGTAETTVTRKGWFVGNTGRLTGDEKHSHEKTTHPSLIPCPKDRACPGGFKVSRLLNAGSDLALIFDQCEEGFTGFECAACRPGYSYTSCIKCNVTRDEGIALAGGILLFLLGLTGIGYIVLKRASRPPLVERRFVVAFEQAEAEFGIGGSLRAFTEVFDCTTEDGVGHDNFMRALRPGGKLESVTQPELRRGGIVEFDTELQTLWAKLDNDRSGTVTAKEFLAFFFNIKRGHHSTNPIRARMARLSDWYSSSKTQTIKVRALGFIRD